MRPRHAVVLTFPIADSRPSWSYLQAGTLPRLISFVCHSCENCRVCTQNSHSETLSPEFANLPSTKLHGGVGRFFRSVHSAFTYPFFRWPELANRPGRLSHAPLQVSIEEDPGPAETVDCQPPLHRFPRVTGHRSRVSDHASFSSSLLTSLPHYFLAPSSLSPLDTTLMCYPVNVANKRLTTELNPLDATFTKSRGWGAPPFDVLIPIPPNVSNAFPIYPLCSHTLVAPADSTALEQLFSNQPVTHSFRRDGGCTPPVLSLSFPAPSLDRNVSIEDLSPAARNRSSVSHESPVTGLASPCPQQYSRLHPPSCILSPGYPPLSSSVGSPAVSEVVMNKTLKIILIVAGVLVVLVLVAPFLIPVNQFRPTIEEKASAALGRKVELGNLSLSLLSGSLSADNISIGDDPKFSS